MPRKGPVQKREIPADPVYHNRMLTRFMHRVMQRGKKSVAERIGVDQQARRPCSSIKVQ